MNFLSPFFLWALPLVLGPLILHLFNQKPAQPLKFSYTPWLRMAHQKAIPKKKLRDLLLLICRTLLILFIIGFFSRPILNLGDFHMGKSEDSSMILLLDVSASMNAIEVGESRLDRARRVVEDMVRKFPGRTRLGLVTYSNRVEEEVPPTEERSSIFSLLEKAKTVSRPTDIHPALELAYENLNVQPKGRKSIVVVSDMAPNGFKEALQKKGGWSHYDPDVNLIFWNVGEAISNIGVDSVALSLKEEGSLGGAFNFHVSGRPAVMPEWTFRLNNRVRGSGQVNLATDQKHEVPLRAVFEEGGYYSGTVELTKDAFTDDDMFYVAGSVPKGFRLLLVDGESGLAPSDAETYYLKLALDSPRDPRLQIIHSIRPESLTESMLNSYEALVLANVPSLTEDNVHVVQRWVEQGGSLFLSAGDNWGKNSNSALGYFRVKSPQFTQVSIEAPNAENPFLGSSAGLNNFEWDQVNVHEFQTVEEDSSLTILLRFSNGLPLLAKRQSGRGFVYLWATTLDRHWTNLPTKPLYSPFFREMIGTLGDPFRQQSSLMGWVGESFKLRVPDGVHQATVFSPQGKSSGAQIDRDGMFLFSNPEEVGIYSVRTDNPSKDFKFAVNLPHLDEEGDLSEVSESDLKSIFPDAPLQVLSLTDKGAESFLAVFQGKDLTRFLVIMLLILFLFETILSSSLGKKMIPIFGRRFGLAAFIICLFFSLTTYAGSGNRFVWGQLKYGGSWDPYPEVFSSVTQALQVMTSIPLAAERRVVSLTDPQLFETPFLLMEGSSDFSLSKDEKKNLKRYIDGGGFVFINDTLANPKGPFGTSVKNLFTELFPGRPFEKLSMDHAVYRSFFLLRNVAGRKIANKSLEGLDVGGQLGGEGRTAVIYCGNDLLGPWLKDRMGNYIVTCDPGGEKQRWESMKLTINVIYFSLTGTYKKDVIHQPFIERKLGN